ncbi:MAG: hypothetical protein ABIZ09_08520 [Rhodoferax sp.]
MNLGKLQHKRGRLVLQSAIEIVHALKEGKFESSFRILPTRFNERGRYVAFSRSVPAQTVAKVQLALDQLNTNSELEQIFSKYRWHGSFSSTHFHIGCIAWTHQNTN